MQLTRTKPVKEVWEKNSFATSSAIFNSPDQFAWKHKALH
ncbi:345_t:CDS:2 [Scutellospora calospora]|uniref:345_t:CDS:1 n=1 Tax=Scutellospora calospora TaxID=85575 RepID=A0ACA9K3Q2_9GLOM|nr:345_t:CDS:2 [Scutellospora calospora]